MVTTRIHDSQRLVRLVHGLAHFSKSGMSCIISRAARVEGGVQNTIEGDGTRIVSDAPSRRLNRTIRILSAGAKGGPGKTFLVKNLSGAAVSEGYNVGIVDFDSQRSIGKWLVRRARKSSHKPGITGYEADPTEARDAKEVLGINSHDLVFFDTPPAIDQHPEVLKTLAYGVELILVPSAVGITDTESRRIAPASPQCLAASDIGRSEQSKAESK